MDYAAIGQSADGLVRSRLMATAAIKEPAMAPRVAPAAGTYGSVMPGLQMAQRTPMPQNWTSPNVSRWTGSAAAAKSKPIVSPIAMPGRPACQDNQKAGDRPWQETYDGAQWNVVSDNE